MKIIEIIKETDVEGKYGPQKRTAFKIEGNPNILSAFSKYSLKVGQEVDGTISQTEKDGKTYHNFSFAKKVQSGMNEAQAYQIKQASESAYAANIGIQQLTKALRDAGVIKDPNKFVGATDVPYPDSEGDMPF